MAYRKTEKVLAAQLSRRESILTAALELMAGDQPVNHRTIAELTETSVGLICNYFADMPELISAAVGSVLARDIATLREAAAVDDRPNHSSAPLRGLARAMRAFYDGMQSPALCRALAAHAPYRQGIRNELAKLIRAAYPETEGAECKLLAAACFGTLMSVFEMSRHSRETEKSAVAFVLLGLGVTHTTARRMAETE